MYEITLEGKVRLINISGGGQYPLFETVFETEANMPQDLRTKLSVLKLARDTEEIKGIGQKVSDTVFWIYDESDALYALIHSGKTAPLKAHINFVKHIYKTQRLYESFMWGCVCAVIILAGTSVAILTGVI